MVHHVRAPIDYSALEVEKIQILNWLVNSPDLNLIENLRFLMKDKVFEKQLTTVENVTSDQRSLGA